jgi:hypothetical protein
MVLSSLGGGLSGKKESGQLRFGGRDKPFNKAPYSSAYVKLIAAIIA